MIETARTVDDAVSRQHAGLEGRLGVLVVHEVQGGGGVQPWIAMLAARLGCVFSQAQSSMLEGRRVSDRHDPPRISLFTHGRT
jgi:hypothetical protein